MIKLVLFFSSCVVGSLGSQQREQRSVTIQLDLLFLSARMATAKLKVSCYQVGSLLLFLCSSIVCWEVSEGQKQMAYQTRPHWYGNVSGYNMSAKAIQQIAYFMTKDIAG